MTTKAPPPSERYRQFLDLEYPRKIVTIEPVMDFDTEEFASWIINIAPELVYLGVIVLEQVKTEEKSNEITAIPQLLELLDVKGCLVTIDESCKATAKRSRN